MKNKKLFLAALTFIAAAALTIPFIGRAENTGSLLHDHATKLESSAAENATTDSSEDLPQVISLEVTPSGFDSAEIIAPRGRFLILLQNRTGRRDLNFWLARENEGRVAESESQKRDWKAQVQLNPGTYIIGETNHPEWKFTIRVTN
ncbi:MAG TPA: hypothetical protein VJR02_27155 [Pyrinomonadaceae bacterium]|nr:hypothetical protein [Pyrinomonadaceae bacterium]